MIILYILYIIYTYLCAVCNQRMLLSRSMPGVFQPLSSSQSLPHCGICPKTQDSLFAVKKAHFVMSNLCSVQDSGEQAAAYGFAGLTYSLRSRAPRHNPAPCMQYLKKTIRFKHKWAFCQIRGTGVWYPFSSRGSVRAGLCVGCWYYPVFLVFSPQTQRAACSARQLGLHAISAALELN